MEKKSLEEKIQRALDYQEIQNVMGRHEYLHAVGICDVEWEELWTHNMPDVSFEHMMGRFEGQESVREFFYVHYPAIGEAHYKEMIKMYPEIEKLDKNESLWIGSNLMHMLTTPVIEVAGDGKTAKAVWYSPGFITIAVAGKLRPSWFFERYAVDFIKEDEEWKIWHQRVMTDFRTSYDKSWVETSTQRMGSPAPRPRSNLIQRDNPYEEYSPLTIPRYEPGPPKPYETFDDVGRY